NASRLHGRGAKLCSACGLMKRFATRRPKRSRRTEVPPPRFAVRGTLLRQRNLSEKAITEHGEKPLAGIHRNRTVEERIPNFAHRGEVLRDGIGGRERGARRKFRRHDKSSKRPRTGQNAGPPRTRI